MAAVITLPGVITSVTDRVTLNDLLRKFGNARRRAFSLKRKGVTIPCIETILQTEKYGLNGLKAKLIRIFLVILHLKSVLQEKVNYPTLKG